jgi:hypothetical protein
MLEDISAFINHITNNKPTLFTTDDTLCLTVLCPDNTIIRQGFCQPSEAFLQAFSEENRRDYQLPLMWQATQQDASIPFEDFVDEALMPPSKHSGYLYQGRAIRYSFAHHVCDFSSLAWSKKPNLVTSKLLIPSVLWEPAFKQTMEDVTNTIRQVTIFS